MPAHVRLRRKEHSLENENWGFFRRHTLFQAPPTPQWIQETRYGLQTRQLLLSFSATAPAGLFHSGLGYHVSGTSKSLAELSEMLPGGRGQKKVNKERAALGGGKKEKLPGQR